MVAPVIDIQRLTKTFGRFNALDHFDMLVQPGEVHAFLGPNGAGKTTTLRILLGLLRANSGHVALFGGDPWCDAVALHRRLVYVPGDVALWSQLTGGEAIDVLTHLHGSIDRRRQADLIEQFALDVRKPCHTYSKGNRQKVALIAALACDVELLVLDEPTSGLDPLMELVFREHIQAAHRRGATVLLSSHILSEVEQLCQRVTIVRNGRRVAHGTLAELRTMTTSQLVAHVPIPIDMSPIIGVSDVVQQGETLRCRVTSAAMPHVLTLLGAVGVTQITIHPPTLEEIFMSHYQTNEV
jgi:ABC-2 type transport system ATP-binding protein